MTGGDGIVLEYLLLPLPSNALPCGRNTRKRNSSSVADCNCRSDASRLLYSLRMFLRVIQFISSITMNEQEGLA